MSSHERGAATAELVMALPALVAVTIGLVWLLGVGSAQLRAVDAARETARALARGDARGAAVARGEQVGPEGTHVSVAGGGDELVITAKATIKGPGGLFAFLPAVTVHAKAVAAVEQSTAGAGP